MNAEKSGQRSAKQGLSLSMLQVRPWISVKQTRGRGGRMSVYSVSVILPPSMRAMPRAQALSGYVSEVSKSRATAVSGRAGMKIFSVGGIKDSFFP